MTVCALCDGEIDPEWWRWWCPSCPFTMHYACVPGGAPVRERPTCPDCSTRLDAGPGEPPPSEQVQPSLF